MSKYGLCEALSLFGRCESQSTVKIISELFCQLKSLEDRSAVQEVAKTEIETPADSNDSRAIPGPKDSERMEFPFTAQTSSKDFVLQTQKHGSEIVSQNSTSLSGLPAMTQDELPTLKSAKQGVSATRMELQIDEEMISSSSPTSTEVVLGKFGSQSGIGRGMNGDAKVKKGNSNEELNSKVLAGTLVVKLEAYGTWWEGRMTTIRSQFRQQGSLNHGIKHLLEVFASTIGIKPMQRRELGERIKRLEWTCVSYKFYFSCFSLQKLTPTHRYAATVPTMISRNYLQAQSSSSQTTCLKQNT
jgi:hypothetical protein